MTTSSNSSQILVIYFERVKPTPPNISPKHTGNINMQMMQCEENGTECNMKKMKKL